MAMAAMGLLSSCTPSLDFDWTVHCFNLSMHVYKWIGDTRRVRSELLIWKGLIGLSLLRTLELINQQQSVYD